MSLGRSSQNATIRPETEEVVRFVERSRRQLGLQRLLAAALRGFCVAAVVLLAVMLLARVLNLTSPNSMLLSLALLPPLVFALPALSRWPSLQESARWLDRERALDDRLATAIELLDGSDNGNASLGRLGGLQIVDTAHVVRGYELRWSEALAPIRRDALAAVSLCIMVVAALLIPGFRDNRSTQDRIDLALNGSAPQSAADLPGESPATTPPTEPGVQPAESDTGSSSTATPEQGRNQASLAQDTQDSRDSEQAEADDAAREAVERIGEALGENSASLDAAEMIERGDYQGAAKELERLGEEADQLSQAAKDQLARDLAEAANDPSLSDTELGERAQEVADALQEGSYEQQRDALRNLGEAIEEAGENASSRQAQSDGRQPANQPGAEDGAGNGTGAGSSDGSQGGAPSGNTGAQPGQEARDDSRVGNEGSESEQPATGERSPRLEMVGERVEVPAELLPGSNLSPANEPSDSKLEEGESGTTGSSAGREATDPSQISPEQNIVPGDRRDIVRDYFNGAGE